VCGSLCERRVNYRIRGMKLKLRVLLVITVATVTFIRNKRTIAATSHCRATEEGSCGTDASG
jgi:hypothetical protein